MSSEKRRFERYVFHKDERIIVFLTLKNAGETVEARVLNISQGGLGLVIERTRILSLKEKTILFLKEVGGNGRFAGLAGHSVEVKWILDYTPLNNLAIGCEFIDLNEKCRLEIDTLLIPDEHGGFEGPIKR
jgi:c-di-GMP-binding flagellar brake protein YcgR